ncbi:Phosphoribosylglycinamide formyltransferase [hydrothermal vent metagenome]|uniref:Phosphoribosylglycinamide formyltransferase n=1 Tax=hydrothermal vent metagenome TaxID=652676 RepID=A0A3B1AFV4_9ZZZZ
MPLEQVDKLRVVILTGSGKMIVAPLVQSGINVVGASEVSDEFSNMGRVKQFLEKIYWKLVKRKPSPYLSLYAEHSGIAYCEKSKITNTEYVQWLQGLSPDLLVLHQAPILPTEIFSIPRFGTLNIHPSLLPKYRGSNPYFWLYYNLDMTAGVTLHYINEKVDTGHIVGQGSFTLKIGAPASEVGAVLVNEYALPMVIAAVQQLESTGKLDSTEQQAESPTPYARRVTNKEYLALLDFEQWTLEHLWHVLHSNEQWRDVFLPEIASSNRYNWALDSFKEKKMDEPYGVIGHDACGFHIKHRLGAIYLRKNVSVKKFIKNVLNIAR